MVRIYHSLTISLSIYVTLILVSIFVYFDFTMKSNLINMSHLKYYYVEFGLYNANIKTTISLKFRINLLDLVISLIWHLINITILV